ncbi:MAG: hypothetical protein FWE38_00005, partial [Firmicutes bacterium]|nr:hypothetical protein [Bacillota bacterium]
YEFYSTWGNGEINQGPDGLLTIPELGGVGQVFFNGNSTSNPFVHFGLINIFETNTFVCAFTNGLATIYGAVYIDIFYYYIWGELFIGGIIELLFPEFWGEGHFDIFWRLN